MRTFAGQRLSRQTKEFRVAWIERRLRSVVLTGCLAWAGIVMAQSGPMPVRDAAVPHDVDRTYMGQNLFVPQGQQIRNVTCLFCSVQVEGDVSGRVLVLFGNLSVTGRVGGNAVVLDGNAVFDAGARIVGDTVVLLGNAVYESDDVLSGSAYVLGGHASNFESSEGQHRRISMSPGMMIFLGVVCCGVLVSLLVGEARLRPLHPTRQEL